MTTATKKKRTWAGYACPVCRFVFRVPNDHDGQGVICPACRYLLNIPERQESPQLGAFAPEGPKPLVTEPRERPEGKPIESRPLGVSSVKPAFTPANSRDPEKPVFAAKKSSGSASRQSASLSTGKKRVRRKHASAEAAPSWERASSSSADQSGGSMPWIVGGSVIGLAVVAIGAWLVMGTVDPDQRISKKETATSLPGAANGEYGTGSVELTPEEQKVQQEITESVNTGMDVMVEAEKVVKAFLNAETLSDVEALVRSPEVTVPRMKKWYATEKWIAPGAKEVGVGGGVTVKGVMASMVVRLNDYSTKHIAVERTPNGYLVDWESWVGWSEVKWTDMFKEKPTELVEVRVTCFKDSYYNRLFDDDSKWLSVRMEYMQEDRSIYGYIDKNTTTLTSLLGDLNARGSLPATLKVRFPEGSIADNQVVIEEYLQNGWVRSPMGDSPDSPSKEDKSTSHEQ